MKIKSGGGITSNKLVQERKGKAEPVSRRVNVDAAAQTGLAVQFAKKPLQQSPGSGYQPYGPKDHTKQGPGAMRTIHRSGSQGLHGSVAQGSRNTAPDVPATSTKGTRDILSEYGSERRR
jgi:hypothetical protein